MGARWYGPYEIARQGRKDLMRGVITAVVGFFSLPCPEGKWGSTSVLHSVLQRFCKEAGFC
jgi:hypothetical protein